MCFSLMLQTIKYTVIHAINMYILPGNSSVVYFVNLHLGDCKRQQQGSDNDMIGIFTFKVWHQVNAVHHLWQPVITKNRWDSNAPLKDAEPEPRHISRVHLPSSCCSRSISVISLHQVLFTQYYIQEAKQNRSDSYSDSIRQHFPLPYWWMYFCQT